MCVLAPEFSNVGPFRAVYFDGPQSDRNREGDEVPSWVVYIGDEDAEPVTHLQHFRSYQIAEQVARQLASTRRLDFVHDASPA